MSNIRVTSIGKTDNNPVDFPNGISGDGSEIKFDPKVISFDPTPLSNDIFIGTKINITFDQLIQFSGVGTISIREESPTGSIATSFTCGVSTEVTIYKETLIIDPVEPLDFGTTYYVILPPVGIANTYGQYYRGTSDYQFKTSLFSATGGTHEFTISSPESPTGFYKYHVFTSTGILTTTAPTSNFDSLSAILVAGGGGGDPSTSAGGAGAGGLLSFTGPTLGLSAGTHTITIGGGGSSGTSSGNPGNDSTIGTPTNAVITTFGGGGGGDGAPASTNVSGKPGGSGGGSGSSTPVSPQLGGTGVSGQGFPGGTGFTSPFGGAGGGGAGESGQNAGTPNIGGTGGVGLPFPQFSTPAIATYVNTIPPRSLSQIGSSGFYAGGGGGGVNGAGGAGGGGGNFGDPNLDPTGTGPGCQNTGGGGAGRAASSGGSGVCMIRYAVPKS